MAAAWGHRLFNDVAGSYAYRGVRGDDMRDAWRDAGNGNTPTYAKPHMRYKIDHTLYRGGLTAAHSVIHDNLTLTPTSSDHYPMVTTFCLADEDD